MVLSKEDFDSFFVQLLSFGSKPESRNRYIMLMSPDLTDMQRRYTAMLHMEGVDYRTGDPVDGFEAFNPPTPQGLSLVPSGSLTSSGQASQAVVPRSS